MAEQLRGLSASDVSKIKRLMASHNNRPVNTTTLPIVPEGDWHENQQTEAYIVKTPSGGIPGRVDGGSGSVIPGHAVCSVYRIGYDLTNNIGDYLLYQSTATDRLVFNLSTSAVAANEYMLVDRDKHGNYVVSGGSGSGQSASRLLGLPCLIRDAGGNIVGLAGRVVYESGALVKCETSDFCDDCDSSTGTGVVPSPPPPVSATISGNVSYEIAAGGGPVVGRELTVFAAGMTTTTDAGGNYSFSGLTGPSLRAVTVELSPDQLASHNIDGAGYAFGETAMVLVTGSSHTTDFVLSEEPETGTGTSTVSPGTSTATPSVGGE